MFSLVLKELTLSACTVSSASKFQGLMTLCLKVDALFFELQRSFLSFSECPRVLVSVSRMKSVLGPMSSTPWSSLYVWTMSDLLRLYSRVGRPRSLRRSSYVFFLKDLIILVARLCIASMRCISEADCGAHTGEAYSNAGHINALYKVVKVDASRCLRFLAM